MPDDEDGPSSTPWGRSGRKPGSQPTPPPGADSGTPPPGAADPATWYAPGTPAPAPGTPAPQPGTPAPLSLDKPADPVHAPPASGQHWTVPEPPPPGAPGGPIYPPGGYPPPPAPEKGGGGAVVVIIAIVVVLGLIGAGIVGLVLLSGGDDDEPDRADVTVTTDGPGTTEAPATDGPGSTEIPPSTDAPGTTEATTPETPSVPGAGDLTPPDAIPRPDGAEPGIVGLEVEGQTVEQVTQFYVDALPGAGFTVGEVQDLGTITVIPVEGNGLRGQLSVTNVSPLPTSVIWTAY